MGGILRSLAIAEEAKARGIPIIIGAQVGETSILTRAALTVANQYRDILLAQEGAFGTYLLEHDITSTLSCLAKGAGLMLKPISGQPGLGSDSRAINISLFPTSCFQRISKAQSKPFCTF